MTALPPPARIEIVDDKPHSEGIIKPRRVRINGSEVLMPADAPLVFSPMPSYKQPLTLTITFLVGSVSVQGEPSPEWAERIASGIAGQSPAAPNTATAPTRTVSTWRRLARLLGWPW